MKTNMSHLMIAAALLGLFAACGKGSDGGGDGDDTGNTATSVKGGGQPSNSTGAFTELSLSLATFGSPTLALQVPTTLDAGGGIVLSSARVSIGAIKIKANKEKSEEENELEEAEEAKEQEDETQEDEQKRLVEVKIDQIEADYKVLIDAATVGSNKDTLEAEMKAKIAAEKVVLATAEKADDETKIEEEAARDESLKWKGPYVYDAITGTVDQAIPSIQLLDGSYKRIEFKLKPNRTVDGADPLLNNAVYLAGTATLGTKSVPFSVAYDAEETFRLTGQNGVNADPGVANSMLIAFDVKGWFTGVDLSTAVLDSLGAIVIDKTHNPELLKVFKMNMKRLAKFGEDDDGDGDLEEGEDEGDGEEAAEAEEAGK